MAATPATNPYYLTPDLTQSKEAMRRKAAYALLMQGSSGEPIQAWTQGLARMAQGAMGGYELYKEDSEDKAREESVTGAIDSMPGMGKIASALSPDAALEPASSQPRGYRNNNPLNIEAGGFTQSQPGFAGSDGRFAKFASLDQGVGAANKLLDTYDSKYGLNTPAGIVGRWAPAGDGNNVNAYAGKIAAALGIDPNAPVPPEMRQKLIAAMAQHENGQPMPGGQQRIAQALSQGQQPLPQTQQQTVTISPSDQAQIRQLWQNPATRQLAMERYQQLTKPKDQEVPLTDPQQRAAAGISPTDKTPYQRNTVTGKISPINTQQQVNIDQRAPNKFEDTYGEIQAKGAAGIVEAGDKASGIYQRNQLLRSLNNAISTGKLTPAQSTIGAWAKSAGIDPASIGVDPNLPTNAETFNMLSNESMMSKLGPGGFPSQNFSDTDRKFLEKTVTNLADQPGANEYKLQISDRISQLQMEKADRWQEISTSVEKGNRADAYEKFERDWRKEIKSRDVFGDLRAQIEAKSGGNQSSGETGIDGWKELGNGVRIREKK